MDWTGLNWTGLNWIGLKNSRSYGAHMLILACSDTGATEQDWILFRPSLLPLGRGWYERSPFCTRLAPPNWGNPKRMVQTSSDCCGSGRGPGDGVILSHGIGFERVAVFGGRGDCFGGCTCWVTAGIACQGGLVSSPHGMFAPGNKILIHNFEPLCCASKDLTSFFLRAMHGTRLHLHHFVVYVGCCRSCAVPVS